MKAPIIPPPPICLEHNLATDGPCPGCEASWKRDVLVLIVILSLPMVLGLAFLVRMSAFWADVVAVGAVLASIAGLIARVHFHLQTRRKGTP